MNDYQYDYEWDSSYCYPNSYVLINKLGIQDANALNVAEREITSARYAQLIINPVKGNLDLTHLESIHQYLFQDIYSWAGKLRTVNIAKGNQFCNCMYLESGSKPTFEKLNHEDHFLISTDSHCIPEKLAYYLGEINVIHPFREGNGRTQRIFIQYLAQIAGYSVDFSNVSAAEMIEASAKAFNCDYRDMTDLFRRITTPTSALEQQQFINSIALKGIPNLDAYVAAEDVSLEQMQEDEGTPKMTL
jgi:cell filamentation protein